MRARSVLLLICLSVGVIVMIFLLIGVLAGCGGETVCTWSDLAPACRCES